MGLLGHKAEAIKLLEENIGKTLSDIHHSRILYDPSLRILEIKTKINKWDLIKLKSFYTAKKTMRKVKRQSSETIKLLEENIGKTLSDINHSRILYDPPSQNSGNKSKNKQMGSN